MVSVSWRSPPPEALPSTAEEDSDKVALLKHLRLGLSSTYYSMAHVLGLRRLQDYIQACGSSSALASTRGSTPASLLTDCLLTCLLPGHDDAAGEQRACMGTGHLLP